MLDALKAGYRIMEAGNGEEALKRTEENRGEDIRLLLSDVVMPRMGGALLAQHLRESRPSIRMPFMSGNADLMSDGLTLPADAVPLQRPFDTRRLMEAVAPALRA
jgi:two-component system cell cycle sensor histidine kinase/response regulator CckA